MKLSPRTKRLTGERCISCGRLAPEKSRLAGELDEFSIPLHLDELRVFFLPDSLKAETELAVSEDFGGLLWMVVLVGWWWKL